MRTRLAAVLSAALLATTLAGCPSSGAAEDCEALPAPVVADAFAAPKPKPPKGKSDKKTKKPKTVKVDHDDDCDGD